MDDGLLSVQVEDSNIIAACVVMNGLGESGEASFRNLTACKVTTDGSVGVGCCEVLCRVLEV